MGGCNSTLDSMLLGGALIGSVIATGGEDAPVVAAGVALSGASAGTLFGIKKGCDKSTDAIVQATNVIVADAIIRSINQCAASIDSDQSISITCDPVMPDGQPFEANPACGSCIQAVFNGMIAQHALERKMWTKTGNKSATVRLPIDEEYSLMIARISSCGVTTCKACALINTSQANILTSSSSCYDTLSDQTVFTTNLQNLISQQLVNNQDVLAGVAKAFGGEGVDQLTQIISSRITSVVTENFLTGVANAMKASQIVNINASGKVLLNNITQTAAFNVALQAVTSENVATKAIASEVFDVIAQVCNQQNTLNDIGTTVFEAVVDIQGVVNNVVGKVMVAFMAALGLVVFVIVGYTVYQVVEKSAMKAAELGKAADISRSQLSVRDQF